MGKVDFFCLPGAAEDVFGGPIVLVDERVPLEPTAPAGPLEPTIGTIGHRRRVITRIRELGWPAKSQLELIEGASTMNDSPLPARHYSSRAFFADVPSRKRHQLCCPMDQLHVDVTSD
jgi:hypothetical protein